jgi:hypothetical protein
MKPFFIALALTLAVAVSVPPASGVDVPSSMIEKVQNKSPRKRAKDCYNTCVINSGCALDIFGQCYEHCSCTCSAKTRKQAKRCPDPT